MTTDATTAFVPGSFWTPERAAAAVKRMTDRIAAPDMQAFMHEIADAAADSGTDPAALTAQMAPVAGAPPAVADSVRAADCTYRRGRAADIPAFVQLILSGDLPPLFIEEFVEGFVAVEHQGEIIGCGGLEVYDGCAVIRSVVLHERARGQNIAQQMTDLLIADARAAGVSDLYLFTMQAHTFWQRLGFVDLPLDAWKQPPRSGWQYVFISQFPDAAEGVYSMWRAA